MHRTQRNMIAYLAHFKETNPRFGTYENFEVFFKRRKKQFFSTFSNIYATLVHFLEVSVNMTKHSICAQSKKITTYIEQFLGEKLDSIIRKAPKYPKTAMPKSVKIRPTFVKFLLVCRLASNIFFVFSI